ncbi:MAG: DMT family transporter [Chloroflexota bacterium]
MTVRAPRVPTHLVAWLPLLITMIVWGVTYALTRHAVQNVGAIPAAMLRFGLGSLVLLGALAIADRGVPRVPTGMGRRLIAGGLLGVAFYNVLFFGGLALAPAIDAAALMPVTTPIATAALAFVLTRERPRRARVLGLLLGVCGAALFLASAQPDAETPHRLLGDLVLMAAAVVWGIYTIVGRPLMAAGGPMRTTTWVVATGTVVLIAIGLPVAAGSGIDWAAQPADLWLAILFLGAISTGIGYSFYYRGIRDLGPTSAALAMLLLPLTGAVASILLLGESLAPLQVAGSLVMAAGAVIAILAAPSPVPAQAAPAPDGARPSA